MSDKIPNPNTENPTRTTIRSKKRSPKHYTQADYDADLAALRDSDPWDAPDEEPPVNQHGVTLNPDGC